MNAVPRKWTERLAHHVRPSNSRAVWELLLTLSLFGAAWFASYMLHLYNVWLGLLLAPLAGLLLIRLFIVQHDCAHQALFVSPAVNDWVGRVLGVFTLTPHDMWRHSHILHHAGSGNLDRRGFGDVDTLTVAEYRAASFTARLKYRMYRHPLVLFGIGPMYLFLLQHRVPAGFITIRGGHWLDVMTTNAGIIVVFSLMMMLVGWQTFIIVHLPIVAVAATVGVWLFFVQHQFSPTFWERAPRWEREHAALHGSSYYDMPQPLMWLTGNIGIHHVHHLSAKIPFYRLPEVLREFSEFRNIGRLTLMQSLACIPLALWDEENARMLTFREFSALEAR